MTTIIGAAGFSKAYKLSLDTIQVSQNYQQPYKLSLELRHNSSFTKLPTPTVYSILYYCECTLFAEAHRHSVMPTIKYMSIDHQQQYSSSSMFSRQQSNNGSPQVLVIGAGPIGLSTALSLSDSGFRVTVAAKQFAPGFPQPLIGEIAGALWEAPPAVCGHHRSQGVQDESSQWSFESYWRFKAMAEDPVIARAAGVHQMRESVFLLDENAVNHKYTLDKMSLIERHDLVGFRRGPEIIELRGWLCRELRGFAAHRCIPSQSARD